MLFLHFYDAGSMAAVELEEEEEEDGFQHEALPLQHTSKRFSPCHLLRGMFSRQCCISCLTHHVILFRQQITCRKQAVRAQGDGGGDLLKRNSGFSRSFFGFLCAICSFQQKCKNRTKSKCFKPVWVFHLQRCEYICLDT